MLKQATTAFAKFAAIVSLITVLTFTFKAEYANAETPGEKDATNCVGENCPEPAPNSDEVDPDAPKADQDKKSNIVEYLPLDKMDIHPTATEVVHEYTVDSLDSQTYSVKNGVSLKGETNMTILGTGEVIEHKLVNENGKMVQYVVIREKGNLSESDQATKAIHLEKLAAQQQQNFNNAGPANNRPLTTQEALSQYNAAQAAHDINPNSDTTKALHDAQEYLENSGNNIYDVNYTNFKAAQAAYDADNTEANLRILQSATKKVENVENMAGEFGMSAATPSAKEFAELRAASLEVNHLNSQISEAQKQKDEAQTLASSLYSIVSVEKVASTASIEAKKNYDTVKDSNDSEKIKIALAAKELAVHNEILVNNLRAKSKALNTANSQLIAAKASNEPAKIIAANQAVIKAQAEVDAIVNIGKTITLLDAANIKGNPQLISKAESNHKLAVEIQKAHSDLDSQQKILNTEKKNFEDISEDNRKLLVRDRFTSEFIGNLFNQGSKEGGAAEGKEIIPISLGNYFTDLTNNKKIRTWDEYINQAKTEKLPSSEILDKNAFDAAVLLLRSIKNIETMVLSIERTIIYNEKKLKPVIAGVTKVPPMYSRPTQEQTDQYHAANEKSSTLDETISTLKVSLKDAKDKQSEIKREYNSIPDAERAKRAESAKAKKAKDAAEAERKAKADAAKTKADADRAKAKADADKAEATDTTKQKAKKHVPHKAMPTAKPTLNTTKQAMPASQKQWSEQSPMIDLSNQAIGGSE